MAAAGVHAPAAALTPELAAARAWCRALALRHYENFPVGRFGVPRDRRADLHAVYAFARTADDFADEPAYEGRRLELLADWGRQLDTCRERAADPVFVALGDTIRRLDLPLEPFRDLLAAFTQDATQRRYETWDEVLGYCRRSANPVGRLVLLVTGLATPARLALSDALCTGLQLANFWQDLSVDLPRGRCYVPRAEAGRFGTDPEALVAGREGGDPAGLLAALVERSRGFFAASRGLPGSLPVPLRWEIAATWLGGRRILEAAGRLGPAAFRRRPSLGAAAKLTIVLRSLAWTG